MNEIYKNNKQFIINYLRKKGATLDVAKDIYQDAMLVLLENISNGKKTEENITRAYIVGISKMLLLKYLSNKSRSIKSYSSLIYEERYLENKDISRAVYKVLKNIQESKRVLLTKIFLEEKTNSEVIEELNLKNPNSLKTSKYKGLKLMKESFDKLYKIEELI